MFSLFKKKTVTPDLSFIGADMHSHLLPGLDDGLQDIETTINFIRELHALGYSKLICTPHILAEIYRNTPETILPKLELVRAALKENGIPITIEAAAEYMVDPDMEAYVQAGKQMLTFGKKNYVLIEMSYLAASPNIEQAIFGLQLKGFQPVLAHPERYNFYHTDFEKYQFMIDRGCILQLNLLSLLGYYGKPVKIIADKLVANKMISLVGTDMHHIKHLNGLKELASSKEFYKQLEGLNLLNRTLL